MKVTQDIIDILEVEVRQQLSRVGIGISTIANSYKERGLTFNRFLWDMFNGCHRHDILDRVYSIGGNDSHMTTALKAVAKTFGITKW